MPNYRRYLEPGGAYFFTVVAARRRPIFSDESARTLLGNILRAESNDRPFVVTAVVLLPDHLHTVWTLPAGDSDYSVRWASIKANFSRQWLAQGGSECAVHPGQHREGRRGVWQPRFYEHLIRDEDDLERHVDYIHYNPVKHGLAASPRDWPWSSFARFVEAGQYPPNWGASGEPRSVEMLDAEALE